MPAFSIVAASASQMPNRPLQLAVAPESIWSVRPPERKTLSAAVSIESVAPEAITVVPASVWLPPLQLKLPETVSVPAPPIVPPDWVKVAPAVIGTVPLTFSVASS